MYNVASYCMQIILYSILHTQVRLTCMYVYIPSIAISHSSHDILQYQQLKQSYIIIDTESVFPLDEGK